MTHFLVQYKAGTLSIKKYQMALLRKHSLLSTPGSYLVSQGTEEIKIAQPGGLGLYGKRLIGFSPYFPCHSFKDQVKPLYIFHQEVTGITPCLSVYHADRACNVDLILISPTTRHATSFSQNKYIIYGAQSSCQCKRINQEGGMCTKTVTELLSGYPCLLCGDWFISL